MKLKKINQGAILPTKEHKTDAAFDLFVPDNVAIKANSRQVVKLGFKVALDKGTCALVFARSGFEAKGFAGYDDAKFDANNDNILQMIYGYTDGAGRFIEEQSRFANCNIKLGLVDENYRGEVGVLIHNHENQDILLKQGDAIGQMLVLKVPNIKIEEVDELSETERGEQGFNA